ncbi:MAG: 23S rRNA (adenine(2503)-C(2))-methyltransferase RlmN [Bacteroidales bacterium]|jgi:23S rRNA (adenine2503-C2)-methyltransferase|nr:23S rRNA (adenine(2503)-C(2))-methyltransferase RlmN [Bacteroidales bacterium]
MDILSLSYEELLAQCLEMGEKKFRVEQLYQWLWQKGVRNFDEMLNLSKSFREQLKQRFYFQTVRVDSQLHSKEDGSTKVAFRLHDGVFVEGVLIPSKDRLTACISSQVGCGLACTFCATGAQGFTRNLSVGEITDQYFALNEIAKERSGHGVSNIVYMGMGEPLQNYNNVMKSIARLTEAKGQAMAPSRITLSTAGIAKFITQLADDGFACNVAISLHAANNGLRTKLMPVNKANDLQKLSDALAYYYEKTHNRISIEYTLLKGVNDSIEHAREMADFTKRFPVKINIIEYNAHEHSQFEKSDKETFNAFVAFLERLNLIVTVRYSKGKDIQGACGQLAKKIAKQ